MCDIQGRPWTPGGRFNFNYKKDKEFRSKQHNITGGLSFIAGTLAATSEKRPTDESILHNDA